MLKQNSTIEKQTQLDLTFSTSFIRYYLTHEKNSYMTNNIIGYINNQVPLYLSSQLRLLNFSTCKLFLPEKS